MNKTEDILYVVMPAYNEAGNIRETICSWIKVLDGTSDKSRLVVADSGSTDDTHVILLDLAKKYKKLKILEKTNKFHGPKVIALYSYAIEQGADYIFQTDSDGQTNPLEFKSFWADRDKYDGILGCRSKREDGKMRALVEKVVCMLLRLFFDVRVPDANAPFRLMRSDLVSKYLNRLPKNYDLPNIILTAYFERFGENIEFKEISFKSRKAGVNSINLKKIFLTGKKSLLAFAKFRKDMANTDPDLAKRIFKRRCCTCAVVFSFFVISFLVVSTSPLFAWNRGEVATDSSVFLTIGRQMKNGSMPYLETFDHKGPVLYLINYFGVLINEANGVLVFEYIALFVSLVFMYKIARLKIKSQGASLFLVLIFFSLYITFNGIDRGNMAEEYALPFISLSIFVFLKYLMKERISTFSAFITGVSCAVVSLLRLNMVAIWVVFLPVIFIKIIAGKNFSDLRRIAIAFIMGFIAVLAPIMIWLVSGGAFKAFIDDYLLFNIAYSKTDVVSIYDTAIYFLGQGLLFLGLALTGYFTLTEKGNNRLLMATLFSAFSVSILVASMSGRNYAHYGIILVPLPIFAFAWLYGKIESMRCCNIVAIILSVFLLVQAYPVWLNISQSVVSSFFNRSEGEVVIEPAKKACDYVDSSTSTDDKIIVYGNWNYIYLRCNRLPASRYSYQFPISTIYPDILDEFFKDVTENKPKIFVVQWDHNDERVREYLSKGGYKDLWNDSEKGTHIYSLQE